MSVITPYPVPRPIPVGNPIKLTVMFRDEDGSLFDPDHGVTIVAVDPTGATSTFIGASVVHESLGVFSKIVQASLAGDWIFKGTGFLADNTQISTPDVAQSVIASLVA